MKAFVHENLFKLDGDIPVVRAIPYGIQHILAMFVANLAPILIVARRPASRTISWACWCKAPCSSRASERSSSCSRCGA